MKKFVIALLVLIMLQFITISCTDSGEIIQNDKSQIEKEYQKTGHGEVGDDQEEEEEEGN